MEKKVVNIKKRRQIYTGCYDCCVLWRKGMGWCIIIKADDDDTKRNGKYS